MSILVGIAVGVMFTILDLEAFGFALPGALALLQLFVTPGLGLGLVGWGIRRGNAQVTRIGLALILAVIVSVVVAGKLNRRKLASSKAAGDAVCLALESYRKSAGRYPHLLQELVPSFLGAVPTTSMGVFRTIPFDYRPDSEGEDYLLGFHSTSFLYCERGRAATWRCDD